MLLNQILNSTSYFTSGLRLCLRSGSGVCPIAVLYFSVAVMLSVLFALVAAWDQAANEHLNKNGFNRLTVQTAGQDGLTSASLKALQSAFGEKDGFRVIPQYTTVVSVRDSAGVYKPFVASSFSKDDPLLAQSPSLTRSTESPTGFAVGPGRNDEGGANASVVVSPDILRRLGYDGTQAPPVQLAFRVSRSGFPDEQAEFELQLGSVVGELDKLGLRVPLETMKTIRQFQRLGHHKEFVEESETEINAIHILVPAKSSFEDSIARVKSINPAWQMSSPWFERGKQRSLLTTALNLSAPMLLLLISVNLLVMVVLAIQKTARDRSQLALMRMSGASTLAILTWHTLPLVTCCTLASLLGAVCSGGFFEMQILPVLQSMLQQPISSHVPYLGVSIGLSLLSLSIHGLATQSYSKPSGLESAFE